MSNRGIARLGDFTNGVCYCHDEPIPVSGEIITSSNTTKVNNLGVARVGDTVMATCGHTGVIVTGKDTHLVDGVKVARLGDTFEGCYIGEIITASEDTF